MIKPPPEHPRLFSEDSEGVSFEQAQRSRGFKTIAGVDEVGRGPLAGPVVAAAVVLPKDFFHPAIKDSKSLSSKQRDQAAAIIRKHAISFGLGIVPVEEIDRINILNASFVAMVKACEALEPRADCILVDGNKRIRPELLETLASDEGSMPRQKAIIKGDQCCLSVSAASILAKVARDAIMCELDRVYPEYGFAVHKGYGSNAHLEALRRLGPSPVHRQSFAPILQAFRVDEPEERTLF
jgi:ribonuclease HII